MKRFLITFALALLIASCAGIGDAVAQTVPTPPAQQGSTTPTSPVQQGPILYRPRHETTMGGLLAAREKLIQRYVYAGTARGVAICGYVNALNGDDVSYLTIYVYSDSEDTFIPDFTAFATPITPEGYLGINGINVAIQPVPRSTQRPSAPPCVETNGRSCLRAELGGKYGH